VIADAMCNWAKRSRRKEMNGSNRSDYRMAILTTLWPRPAAVSLLASTTLLVCSARGQEANSPSLSNTNPAPAVVSTQAANASAGFRLGPLDIQPRVVTGVTYDDNILISSQNRESDVIWSLQPAFLAVAGDRAAIEEYQRTYHKVVSFSPDTFVIRPPEDWPGKTLLVDYGPRFNWFTKHTENDCIDEFLNFTALWPIDKLILGVHQGYVLQDTTIIEAGQRTSQQIVPTVLTGGYRFSDKTTTDTSVGRHAVSYQEGSGLADYTDWNWNTWLNYQYGPKLNLSAGVNVGLIDLASQPNQTYETPMVRARFHYGPRALVDASAGAQMRQYDRGVPNTTEAVFKVTGYYQAFERTSVSLSLFRDQLPSVGYGYDYVITGASAGVWQEIADRLFATLSVGYYHADYLATASSATGTPGADRVDNYVDVMPGLEFRFNKHLVGNAFYEFRNLESREQDGWSDNRVGAQLTWTF
jgi:hypothetical protein